jgi:hypothetical protein
MPFPIFGLPAAWEGRRALAGSSFGRATGLAAVTLEHAIGDGARSIRVTTRAGTTSGVADLKEDVEIDFGLRDPADDAVGELEWRPMQIPVDGTRTPFQVIAGGQGQWGAVGAVGAVAVAVEVRNFAMADVVLERVVDVRPYLEGRAPR